MLDNMVPTRQFLCGYSKLKLVARVVLGWMDTIYDGLGDVYKKFNAPVHSI